MAFDKTRRIVTTPPMISLKPTDNRVDNTQAHIQARQPVQQVMREQMYLARALRDRNNTRKGTVARPQVPTKPNG